MAILVVASYLRLIWPDLAFHAVLAVLVLRAFAFELRGTLIRLVLASVLVFGGELVSVPEDGALPLGLEDWPVMIALVFTVAVLADRREKATRRFASLYEEAIEQRVAGEEELRRRFALDLHDGVGQTIGAMMLTLDMAQARLEPSSDAAPLVVSAGELAEVALQEVRSIAFELRPARMNPAGLLEALRDLAQHAGIPCRVAVEGPLLDTLRLPEPVETAAFRITQEAIANVVSHSRATEALIRLRRHDGRLRIQVRDNGVGFDTRAVRGSGIGLIGMEERAAGAGGRLSVQSRRGRGTIVTLELPVAAEPSLDARPDLAWETVGPS